MHSILYHKGKEFASPQSSPLSFEMGKRGEETKPTIHIAARAAFYSAHHLALHSSTIPNKVYHYEHVRVYLSKYLSPRKGNNLP